MSEQYGILLRWESRTQLKRGIRKCLEAAAGCKADWSLLRPGSPVPGFVMSGFIGCKFYPGTRGAPKKDLFAIVAKFSPALSEVVFRTIRRAAK